MLYLLMADGTKGHVETATMAAVEGEELICRDRDGRTVARFDKMTVTAYGDNDALREPASDAAMLSSVANPASRDGAH